MSRGFGTVQRAMLFTLARHEVAVAETAAQLQRPYRSPDRWSLRALTWGACHEQIEAQQRAAHDRWQETLRRRKAGDEDAVEHVAFLVNIAMRFRKPRPKLDPSEFKPHPPSDHDLQRFNPGRALAGLERRGLVLRDGYSRHDNLALTVAGFAEARRLGGVPDTAIVDLDRVQANWRGQHEFMLGYCFTQHGDDTADAIRWASESAEEE